MFLSRLCPDPRDAAVRRDLTNPYDLHRTLLRAFPGADDGGPGRVLFRAELPRDGLPVVLVQSDAPPAWDRLPARYLRRPAEFKSLPALEAAPGRRLLFRLRANPTTKVQTLSKADRLAKVPGRNGKRVGLLGEAEQLNWLTHKGEAGGFRLPANGVRVAPEGTVRAWKGGSSLSFLAVRFDGILEVTDPAAFRQTLAAGVGPAKGLGFGLLSVART